MAGVIDWMTFQLYAGMGTPMARRILDVVHHPSLLFQERYPDLVYANRLTDRDYERMRLLPELQEKAKRCYEQGLKAGATPLTLEDEEYPERLRELYSPPLVLWVLGNCSFPLEEADFAVVGTRQITPYGFRVSSTIAGELSLRGATIVSGLALGVDTACHEAAVRNHGKTIAVIGTGIDQIYPYRNRTLQQAILENGGAIVSEFLPGEKAMPYHFPLRNRIISGLSLGVIVAESGRKSGSLITAGHALTQNRPIFAVPGDIFSETSEGCNWLIRQGAHSVSCAQDVLDYFPELHSVTAETVEVRQEIFDNLEADGYNVQKEAVRSKKRKPASPKIKDLDTSFLSERQQLLYGLMKEEPESADVLAERSGYTIAQVLAAMTQLEIFGLIQTCSGRRFAKL